MTRSMLTKGSALVFALFMVTAGSLIPRASWADGGHGHRHGHGSRHDAGSFIWHVLQAKEALALTDDQEMKLRTIGITYKKARVTKTAEMELAEIDMHQLLHEKPIKHEAVEPAIRKVYALKADLRIASVHAREEAKAVLTPEQQQKLRGLHKEMHGAMAGGQEKSCKETERS